MVMDCHQLCLRICIKNIRKIEKVRNVKLKNIFHVNDSFKHSKNTSYKLMQFFLSSPICSKSMLSTLLKKVSKVRTYFRNTTNATPINIPVRGVAPRSLNHFKPRVLITCRGALQRNLHSLTSLNSFWTIKEVFIFGGSPLSTP